MNIKFDYLHNSAIRRELISFWDGIVLDVQQKVRELFTFSFNLVGSGKTRLITVDSNNHIDLDYNLVIQRDKVGIVDNPKKLKLTIMNEFRKYLPKGTHVCDSTSAITIKNNNFKIDGYKYSADFAILCEGNDGYYYKLLFNKAKNENVYLWGRVKKSHNFGYKFARLKEEGMWLEIKEKYIHKKRTLNKPSFTLLIEVVNELCQKYGI